MSTVHSLHLITHRTFRNELPKQNVFYTVRYFYASCVKNSFVKIPLI